jgi:hypothetical protein
MNILLALALFFVPIIVGAVVLAAILIVRLKLPPFYAAVRRAMRSRIASVGPGASAA